MVNGLEHNSDRPIQYLVVSIFSKSIGEAARILVMALNYLDS